MRMTKACLVLLVTLGASATATAQTQVKPYFMVMFDDSGSMGDSTGGGNNSCGRSHTKLNDAKCALQRVVAGFGDVVFGLASFREYGTGTTIHVPIAEDNQAAMLSWVDFGGTPELTASGGTPIHTALANIRAYYQSATGPIRTDMRRGCRPYYVILLHDGAPASLSQAITQLGLLLNTPVTGGPNVRIETYVIYFGTSSGDLSNANDMAAAGGTGTAQQATNEDALALAFANIIADSILTEVCDGSDNDCDTLVDEGFQLYCNLPGGVTTPSLCADPGDPCDGTDDNCFDGTADEMTNLCGTCGPAPAEVCDGIDNNCDGVIDEGGICMGCVPSGAERCDNIDNDCDTRVDEGLTRPCGTSVGACTTGVETCSMGTWGMCSGRGPGTEICDGIDNDCDGLIDGMTRPCGSSVGTCVPGTEICIAGMYGACTGGIGPGTEVCDGLDNDCDGMTDEADPMIGDTCGDDTGECTAGTIACVSGTLTCTGGVGPTMEICDGLDNDCDGVIDDGLGVGDACGSSVGACRTGVNVCRGGMIVCDGEVTGTDETCNGIDDDCDGPIDESLPVGEACGTDEGVCMAGGLECIDGREVCVGEVPAGTERCDCEDNDCDGMVDEAVPDPLCPGESRCISCQCAGRCQMSEFGYVCPTGRTAQVMGDECFCVEEACNADTCAGETVERDGEVLCGPDSTDVSSCVCKNNACTFPCDGVTCADGTVCNPRDPTGRCVADNCRGLGCPGGQLCDTVTGACMADPCEDVTCAADEACRMGVCIGSCADVDCDPGLRCTAGTCVRDECDGVSCMTGEVCDPADGSCVEDMCDGVRCPAGAVCDPVDGTCGADPCIGLRCPDDQVCEDGECANETMVTPDGGMMMGPMDGGTGGPMGGTGEWVVATGGCGVAPRPAAPRAPFGLVLLTLLGALVRRRSRARPKAREGRERAWLAALLGGVLALLASGCESQGFCIADCGGDGGSTPVDAGSDSGSGSADAGPTGTDAGPGDAGPDGCVPGSTELCNGLDEDCDGNVDEGIDTDTDLDNCGGCGMACAPPGAFGVCTGGVCGIDECDVGRYDLDGDPSNGCEYRCITSGVDDSVCDRADNDCDGMVDEDFDFQNDPANCGSCARRCAFAHSMAMCVTGTCALGACATDWWNINGVDADGCEYHCTPSATGVETCNRVDDDCDGMVDEGDPGGGAACGSDVGACTAGVEACIGGAIQCMGSVGPSTEVCNGIDDNCDGRTDEGFLGGDINNCGMCGRVCSFANAVPTCMSGTCVMGTCLAGYVNADGNPANGCEYRCDATGTEICNGRDDDCDTRTDEGLTPPTNFCNPNGICMGTTPRCDPATGWTCDYPSTYETPEVSCDALDNDCNGIVDDPFVAMGLGNACSNGTGRCQQTGMIVCDTAGTGVECNAPAAGTPMTEICDGFDNDCDGSVDEPRSAPGTNPSYVVDDMVQVRSGLWVYRYEASRPDATATSQGGRTTRSCSRGSVLPWTQVTAPQAAAACAAAGYRLCTEAEWQDACESSSGSCAYAYASSCNTYQMSTCNGNDYDSTPGGADDDALLMTGARPSCYASFPGGERIWDLSGNAWEWTQPRSAGVNPMRGGSYNNPGPALRCDFDFVVAPNTYQLTNVGFRCCSSTAP